MSRNLREFEAIARRYGKGIGARKSLLLDRLAHEQLVSARAVHRLHEALCFLLAYPDDAAIRTRAERLLDAFPTRSDLRRHAGQLRDSGIAGTDVVFGFFFETAKWLVQHWPDRLTLEWDEIEAPARLEAALPLLALWAETPGLDEWAFPLPEWLDRLKGPDETDAAFVVRRFTALAGSPILRQFLYEDLGLTLRLSPGPGTPARTHARMRRAKIHYQRGPIAGERPDVRAELSRPPESIASVPRRQAQQYIDMARAAMVTRSRDLDAFAYGDPDDVRLVDCGGGLEFAVIGVIPERRLLLEAVYAFLTLRNGVPVGYVLNSALFGSAEIAYNVFDTYRGAEAGPIYGRVLSTVHHIFGADTFTIYPYQLGHENDEALESGAWWFYQKLGFRSRDQRVLALMDRELDRIARDPGHRSSIDTLRQLANGNVYFQPGRPRDDVIGVLPLANVGLAVSRYLAKRFGSDREGATEVCRREARSLLGVRSTRGFSDGERLAWDRWAPLVMAIPGISRWGAGQRADLARIVRAKGGRRESDFVHLFDAHRRLRRAIHRIALAEE